MPECATCNDTGDQVDDRNCDCFISYLDGAGQHSPDCACCRPCPCGKRTPGSTAKQQPGDAELADRIDAGEDILDGSDL